MNKFEDIVGNFIVGSIFVAILLLFVVLLVKIGSCILLPLAFDIFTIVCFMLFLMVLTYFIGRGLADLNEKYWHI